MRLLNIVPSFNKGGTESPDFCFKSSILVCELLFRLNHNQQLLSIYSVPGTALNNLCGYCEVGALIVHILTDYLRPSVTLRQLLRYAEIQGRYHCIDNSLSLKPIQY